MGPYEAHLNFKLLCTLLPRQNPPQDARLHRLESCVPASRRTPPHNSRVASASREMTVCFRARRPSLPASSSRSPSSTSFPTSSPPSPFPWLLGNRVSRNFSISSLVTWIGSLLTLLIDMAASQLIEKKVTALWNLRPSRFLQPHTYGASSPPTVEPPSKHLAG